MLHFCTSQKSPILHMFHRTLFHVLDAFPFFCSTPPPTQTSLPNTGIRMNPSATPRGGMMFARLVERSPLTIFTEVAYVDDAHVSLRSNQLSVDCVTDHRSQECVNGCDNGLSKSGFSKKSVRSSFSCSSQYNLSIHRTSNKTEKNHNVIKPKQRTHTSTCKKSHQTI